MVRFNRLSQSGNIFKILADADRELRREHKVEESLEMLRRVLDSTDYDVALDIIREYVELEEVDDW